ncbi:MAG: serine/threonine protein phosphatase [Clostridia bacterium]|nr:serine/threonine protein phosphatase [Clostridia bacterium]
MTYCISDVHGEYELFMHLLEKIKYEDSDRLIVCGDFIDKGAFSVRLMKTIFDLPNAYCLMGNHEFMFLKFYRSKIHFGVSDWDSVLWHLQQYFPKDGKLLDWDTVDRLTGLPYYIEDSDFICVHAGLPMDEKGKLLPPDEALPEELVHDRRFKNPNVLPRESKCVLFGHTPTVYVRPDPKIIAYPKPVCNQEEPHISDYYKIHLDTGVAMTGVLGCFCTDTCTAHYVTKSRPSF